MKPLFYTTIVVGTFAAALAYVSLDRSTINIADLYTAEASALVSSGEKICIGTATETLCRRKDKQTGEEALSGDLVR